MIVKPVEAAPVTVAVPAKPGMRVDRGRMFAFVYASPLPPITAESLPPIRTWNGEKNVIVPPPELARPAVGFVYVNDAGRRDRRDGERAVVAGHAGPGDHDHVAHGAAVRRRRADRDRVADLASARAR